MRPMFTPEELAEMAAFDAQVDEEELTAKDFKEQAERDREAVMAEMSADQRRKKKKIAAHMREYRAKKKMGGIK